jgi:hypothetical protein
VTPVTDPQDNTVGELELIVEEALGPGVDVEVPSGRGYARAARVRSGVLWLGVDRASIPGTDDGAGRTLPALLATPASTFPGCRATAVVRGGFHGPRDRLVVAALPGATLPPMDLLRVVGRVDPSAAWQDAGATLAAVDDARRRFREREAHQRIVGGRAWRPPEGLPLEALRGATAHSRAELRLDRLPPRFLRGLEGLLDDDERLLVAVERPPTLGGVFIRRGGPERRAALLLLTDRQLAWLVDHTDPDRYLMDWGVDVDLVALERVSSVRLEHRAADIVLGVETRGQGFEARLPVELEDEVTLVARLIERFAHPDGTHLVRRYPVAPISYRVDPAGLFGQAEAAAAAHAKAEREAGPLLAFLFSPRREGQRHEASLGVAAGALVAQQRRLECLPLEHMASLRVELSPLFCGLRIAAEGGGTYIRFPGPLQADLAALVRVARRRWASHPAPSSDAAS